MHQQIRWPGRKRMRRHWLTVLTSTGAHREELERALLPLATSVDGRRFTLQASLHRLALQAGGYVVLEGDGQRFFGQVLTLRSDSMSVSDFGFGGATASIQVRGARGEGIVLEGSGQTFHDALVRPATPEEVDAWIVRVRPDRSALTIGDLLLAPGVAATLDAGGFNRHTFMCGQSGSGKTYSLGLVLERLLVETSLRMVILDPNSDYVRLSEVRDNIDPHVAARYSSAASGVSVWRNHPDAQHPLRLQLRRGRRCCSSSTARPRPDQGSRRACGALGTAGHQREGQATDRRPRRTGVVGQSRCAPARPTGCQPGRN